MTEQLIAKFRARMQTATDYYEAWLWADADRHRLMGLEWIAIKRALRAEAEVKRLKQQIRDMQMQHEFLFPTHKVVDNP